MHLSGNGGHRKSPASSAMSGQPPAPRYAPMGLNEGGKRPLWENMDANVTENGYRINQTSPGLNHMGSNRQRMVPSNRRGGPSNVARRNVPRGRGVVNRGASNIARGMNRRNGRKPRRRGRGGMNGRGRKLPLVATPEVANAVKKAETPTGPYTGYTDDDFDDIYLRSESSSGRPPADNYQSPHDLGHNMQMINVNSSAQTYPEERQYAMYEENIVKPNEVQYYQRSEPQDMMSDVNYCQKQQPVLATNHSCLFPPKSSDAPKIDTKRLYNPNSVAVVISCLPSVVDEELIKEIFERFGEISKIKLEAKIMNEKLTKLCEIKFKHEGSAIDALKFDNHYIFVGREGTLMLPLMTSQIHVDLIDVLPDDYPIFSQAAVSQTMASLLNEGQFVQAARTVQRWFLHGECNSSNFNTFFALVSTANGFLEQLIGLGDDLKKLIDSQRKEEDAKVSQLKEKCNSMEALFYACRNEHILKMFSEDQKRTISNYALNIYKETDMLHVLMDNLFPSRSDKGSKEIEEKFIKEKEEERNARRLEELKVQRMTEENLDLKSRIVSLEIEREKLVWVIKELEKQQDNRQQDKKQQDSKDRSKDKMKEKDKQIESLQKQLEGLKQFVFHGGKVDSRHSRDYRSRRDHYDDRDGRKDREGRHEAKVPINKATQSPKVVPRDGSDKKMSQRKAVRQFNAQRDKRTKGSPSVSTKGNQNEAKNTDECDEAACFTIIDEVADDSEEVVEIVQKNKTIITIMDSMDSDTASSQKEESDLIIVSSRKNGLVQYSDDHTSDQIMAGDNTAVESSQTGTQDTTPANENLPIDKDNDTNNGKRKREENEEPSQKGMKLLSKVSETILKRLKLGSTKENSNSETIVKADDVQSEQKINENLKGMDHNIAAESHLKAETVNERAHVKIEIASGKPNALVTESHDNLLCSILSIALNTYPQGATIDDLKMYCQSNNIHVTPNRILDILKEFSSMFECSNAGSQDERWSFKGFKILEGYSNGP